MFTRVVEKSPLVFDLGQIVHKVSVEVLFRVSSGTSPAALPRLNTPPILSCPDRHTWQL